MKAVTLMVVCLVAGAGICHAFENQQLTSNRRLMNGKFWKMTTVWDIIKGSKDHKTLAAVIEANGLVAALDKPGLTVFAPTDAAFKALLGALPKDVILNGGLVKTILFHHVVPVILLSASKGSSITTLNAGNPIKALGSASWHGPCSYQDGQGNKVNSPTRIYTKGAAVYVTDAVLLPNNAFPSIEAAVKFYSAQLSTLTDLVVKANLVGALNAVQPQKTVFAPINKGFEAIASTVATLSSEQVTQVLTYHVSGAGSFTVDFKPQTISTLLTPQTLTLVAPKSIKDTTDTAAEVLVANIWYPGGVIQAINKVLLPKL